MSEYGDIIYPTGADNSYPIKLCQLLCDKFVRSTTRRLKILDIGCSKGILLEAFSTVRNFECYGIDLRDENAPGMVFRQCNIENEAIPFEDDFFDVIFTKSVVEHVYDTDNFLSEAKRVLKPGGAFICMTPDWKSQMHTFYNDYTHVKPFTRKGLQDAMLINGFKDVSSEYFYQLPFIWRYPFLKFVPMLVAALTPDSWSWKDSEERNTKDRKLIRFSKELMLLGVATKSE